MRFALALATIAVVASATQTQGFLSKLKKAAKNASNSVKKVAKKAAKAVKKVFTGKKRAKGGYARVNFNKALDSKDNWNSFKSGTARHAREGNGLMKSRDAKV